MYRVKEMDNWESTYLFLTKQPSVIQSAMPLTKKMTNSILLRRKKLELTILHANRSGIGVDTLEVTLKLGKGMR